MVRQSLLGGQPNIKEMLAETRDLDLGTHHPAHHKATEKAARAFQQLDT